MPHSQSLMGIGLISFSSYLWHQPLLAFARQRYLKQLEGPLRALISVAAFRQLDPAISDAVSAMPANAGVADVSTMQAFMPAGQALWAGDCLLFRDNGHLSRCGEDPLAKRDNTALAGAIKRP